MKKSTISILAFGFQLLVFGLSAQNVGIGTTTPRGTLDLNGDMIFRKGSITLDPTGAVANIYDNVDLSTNRFSYYDVTVLGTCIFTGFTGGVDGRTITLYNTTANLMAVFEKTSSAAANQIFTGNGMLVINGYGSIVLRYMGTDNLWHVIGSHSEQVNNFWNSTGNNIYNTNSGNVGIGTNNPTEKLTVNANGIGLSQQSVNGAPAIGFYTSSIYAGLQTHNNYNLNFSTNSGPTQMTLNTNGYLGIGCTPRSTLDVGGAVRMPIVVLHQSDAPYTIQPNDYTIVVDFQKQATNTQPFNMFFPDVAANQGRILKIVGANMTDKTVPINIYPLGHLDIDYFIAQIQLKFYNVNQYSTASTDQVITFQSDGLKWYKIDKNF